MSKEIIKELESNYGWSFPNMSEMLKELIRNIIEIKDKEKEKIIDSVKETLLQNQIGQFETDYGDTAFYLDDLKKAIEKWQEDKRI